MGGWSVQLHGVSELRSCVKKEVSCVKKRWMSWASCLKVTKSQMYFYWNCEENFLFSGGWLAYKWLQSKIQELRNAEDKEYLERLK